MRRAEHARFTIAAASNAASAGPNSARTSENSCAPRHRPVDAVAPLDHVQIQLEDPRFFNSASTARDDQLRAACAADFRRRQIQVLRQLLGDGAAAAREFSARQSISIDSWSCPMSIPSCCQNASSSATSTARFRSGEMRP